MIQAQSILFDLDGTLMDTAPDLVGALNMTLAARGRPAVSLASARPYVSRGARGLLQRGFALAPDADEYQAHVDEFLEHYRSRLCDQSTLFDGMAGLLDALDSSRCPWGIVTNKMASLTEPLLSKMGLMDRLHVLVSGDTIAEKKPSPKPLLYACDKGGMQPEETIYVGDDPRDILAANAAGLVSVAARYGYFDDTENPDQWGADLVIDHPLELVDLIPALAAAVKP